MSKINVESKTAKKIGLFVAINMLIGSVIGIGIFFKNNNIFTINENNSIFVLIGWIVAAIISLFTAICFAEVGSSSYARSGLGDWCHKLISKGFGNFIKIIQPLFYFGILIFSISIFASESIFNIFNYSDKVNFGIIMLVGLILFLFFFIFNLISIKLGSKLQMIINFFKFIPIIFIIIFGIYFGIKNPNQNMFITNNLTNNHNANFATILMSLPSILFAFDSFVSIGNISKDMHNPKKNVPLAIIIAMLTVGIVYILVTVGQIMTSCGDIYQIFGLLTNDANIANIIKIIVSVFIMIAVIGVLNGFSSVFLRSCFSLIDEKKIIFHEQIDNIANKLITKDIHFKSGFILGIIYYLFLFVALIIPSSIINSDVFIDGVSNLPTTFIFFVYGTVILFGLINRKTKKVEVIKMKIFVLCAPIAIIGCYLVFFFQVFYTYSSLTIIDPNGIVNWGLFATNNYTVVNWQATLVFGLYLLLMVIYFIINKVILDKKTYYNSQLYLVKDFHV